MTDETGFAPLPERVNIAGYESIATTVLRLQSLAHPDTDTDTDALCGRGDADWNGIAEPTDVIWLVPTSGTTGSPKLAMLTHRSVLTAAYGCHLARPVTPDDTYLYAFPLCHVAAYNVIVYHQFSRPVIVLRRFDPVAGVAAITEHRVTSASLAPTMIAMLLDTPGLVDGGDLSSLRTIGYGSSGIPDAVLRNAMQTLGCDFSQGYGMTELSGNAAFLSASDHRIGLDNEPERLRSAGVATPLVELRVVDERGTPVQHGAVGEIAARGDQVMAGYFDDPAATAAAIVDGWLRTGDLATIDAQGYITIVDRKKDIIITGGENVASREVERVLHEHRAVREAAVIGVPDNRWGELVTAVIALRPGIDADADELIGHCRAQLAGFKAPRHVWFVDELPKNTTGKINKSALRQTFALRPEGGPHDLHASQSHAVGS